MERGEVGADGGWPQVWGVSEGRCLGGPLWGVACGKVLLPKGLAPSCGTTAWVKRPHSLCFEASLLLPQHLIHLSITKTLISTRFYSLKWESVFCHNFSFFIFSYILIIEWSLIVPLKSEGHPHTFDWRSQILWRIDIGVLLWVLFRWSVQGVGWVPQKWIDFFCVLLRVLLWWGVESVGWGVDGWTNPIWSLTQFFSREFVAFYNQGSL